MRRSVLVSKWEQILFGSNDPRKLMHLRVIVLSVYGSLPCRPGMKLLHGR